MPASPSSSSSPSCPPYPAFSASFSIFLIDQVICHGQSSDYDSLHK
jgi:hypothetical protein